MQLPAPRARVEPTTNKTPTPVPRRNNARKEEVFTVPIPALILTIGTYNEQDANTGTTK